MPSNITTPVEGQTYNITEGDDGLITCTATGYPPPTVVWRSRDGSILNNNRVVAGSPLVLPTGVDNITSVSVDLRVTNAMREDSGIYICSADNYFINQPYVTIELVIQCE